VGVRYGQRIEKAVSQNARRRHMVCAKNKPAMPLKSVVVRAWRCSKKRKQNCHIYPSAPGLSGWSRETWGGGWGCRR